MHRFTSLIPRTLRALSVALLCLSAAAGAGPTFYNPIVAAGQDPSVLFYNGYYYLAQSSSGVSITVTKSRTLTGLAAGTTVTVWSRPATTGPLCCNVWAPELQLVNGRFYIYFAADDGNNDNHRMYALESNTLDPQGSYTYRG